MSCGVGVSGVVVKYVRYGAGPVSIGCETLVNKDRNGSAPTVIKKKEFLLLLLLSCRYQSVLFFSVFCTET